VTYRKDDKAVEVFDGSAFGPIGKILQVVSTAKTDAFSASVAASAVTAITGLTASITPTSTSSKILVFLSSNIQTGTGEGTTLRITRNGSSVFVGDTAGARRRETTSGGNVSPSRLADSVSAQFLDSPETTSSLTYGVSIGHQHNGAATVFVNRSSNDADLSDGASRTASSITLMEVAG
jgi:hypothetical protein